MEERRYRGTGKVHSITGHEGSEVEYSFFNLGAIEGVGCQRHAPPLYPRERPGTYYIGGWVGPRAGLDECRISRPHRD